MLMLHVKRRYECSLLFKNRAAATTGVLSHHNVAEQAKIWCQEHALHRSFLHRREAPNISPLMIQSSENQCSVSQAD
jgi:hypothetical protein